MVLTNGVSHKSSFIGLAVWGFASKIKSIYALSLVQPFTAPTFMHRKTDLLTSKSNRNEKDREQFRSNRIRGKRCRSPSVHHHKCRTFPAEKNGEDTKRISAFMNIEAWRKNENTGSFDQLTKGTLLTVEGYFKPEEWTDKDGVLHNRIVTVAVKFYPAVDKEEEVPAEPAKKPKKGKK